MDRTCPVLLRRSLRGCRWPARRLREQLASRRFVCVPTAARDPSRRSARVGHGLSSRAPHAELALAAVHDSVDHPGNPVPAANVLQNGAITGENCSVESKA